MNCKIFAIIVVLVALGIAFTAISINVDGVNSDVDVSEVEQYDSISGTDTSSSTIKEVSDESSLFDAIESNDGSIIKLTTNISIKSTLTIPENQTVIIDLNDYELTISPDVTKEIDVIDNNGNLTIKNGTVASLDKGNNTQGMAVDNLSGATLTVEQDDGHTTKLIGRCGIQNYGAVTVYNGIIESYNRNAYWGSTDSTLVVHNGSFISEIGSSGYGRAISTEGDVTLYGGYYYSGGSSGAGDNYMNAIGMFNGAHLIIDPSDGMDIQVISETDYAVSTMGNATIEIYGGEFSCNGVRTDILDFDGNNIAIYGGSFKHEPYQEYLAEGYISIKVDERYIVNKAEDPENTFVSTLSELETALNHDPFDLKIITIADNITISSGYDLTVRTGDILIIDSDTTLTVDGVLRLDGNLDNRGYLKVGKEGFIEHPLKIDTTMGVIKEIPDYQNGTYEIRTPMDLQWLSCLVEWNNDSIPETVLVMNDIELPDVEFTPIGNSSFYYYSTFDGQNHSISNIEVNVTSEYRGGLFGKVGDVTIRDLTISGTSTNSTSSYIGGLAGYMTGNCKVIGVSIEEYTISSPISYGVGGFVGQIYVKGDDPKTTAIEYTETVEFINCSFNGNITGYANVGGFWGTSTGSLGNISVYNSSLSGTVNTINVNGAIVGGYAAGAYVTVINLDCSNMTATVKEEITNKLLAYTEKNNNLNNSSTEYKAAIGPDGNWFATDSGNIEASIDGIPYTDLSYAIGQLSDDDVLKLETDFTEHTITIDKPDCSITLDLNGHSITGSDSAAVLIVTDCAEIIIEDSKGDGRITSLNAPIFESSKPIRILSGIFDGELCIDETPIVIYNGSFTDEPADEYIADGYMATEKDGMWNVVESVVVSFDILQPSSGPSYQYEIPIGALFPEGDIPECPPSGEDYTYVWMDDDSVWDPSKPINNDLNIVCVRVYTFTITSHPENPLQGQEVTLTVEDITYADDVRYYFTWFSENEETSEVIDSGYNKSSITVTHEGTYSVSLSVRYLDSESQIGSGQDDITVSYGDFPVEEDTVEITVPENTIVNESTIGGAISASGVTTGSTINLEIGDSESVKITASAVNTAVSAETTLIITSNVGSITVGSETLSAMVVSSTENQVLEISIIEADSEDLTPEQAAVVNDRNVFELYATLDGVYIENFVGTVTVSLNIDISQYQSISDIVVFYIDDLGTITDMPTQVFEDRIEFTTTHFSYYFVGDKSMIPEEPEPEYPPFNPGWNDDDYIPLPPVIVQEPSDNNDDTTTTIACSAAAVVAAIMAVFLIMEYRKK